MTFTNVFAQNSSLFTQAVHQSITFHNFKVSRSIWN